MFSPKFRINFLVATALLGSCIASQIHASSHREAPFIAGMPQLDATDLYMFNSYEEGREGYVTLIANYIPIQAPYGGPNYFDLDDKAIYEIHIDNNGDSVEDLTFRFKTRTITEDLQLDIAGEMVSVPLKNIGGIGPETTDIAALNVRQRYSLDMIRGDRRYGSEHQISNSVNGSYSFAKPADNIGNKSIADYATYANNHIFNINIPNCGSGRVFVGQRKEGFAVNLGEVFDLVNTNPLGAPDAEANLLADANVTSFALEIPTSCLTYGDEDVIGAWTSASLRQVRILNPEPFFLEEQKRGVPAIQGGAYTQVSRLGMPLVNELIIGLKDKNRFNASEPEDDEQFLRYVSNPTLPALLEILFADAGARAPLNFPRTDLIATFLTGLEGLNQPANVEAAEMLRLNTSIAALNASEQSNLGALAGDIAGFPNGRRPGDDVVDIELRVAMGALVADATLAPNNALPFTDGATVNAGMFYKRFPYLTTPIPGSPNNY